MTDTDRGFIPPKKIAALEDVPEFWRDGYLPTQGGGFQLHPAIAAEIDAGEAKIATQCTEHARQLAELDTKHERYCGQVKDSAIRKAVDKALNAAGVTPRDKKFATANLLDKYRFIVRDDPIAGEPVATVETDMGEISVEAAVGAWLTSEDGRDFLPPIDPRGDGMFAGMVRSLASTVH
jgi:hypothetical protein